jgi:hypothetical protein
MHSEGQERNWMPVTISSGGVCGKESSPGGIRRSGIEEGSFKRSNSLYSMGRIVQRIWDKLNI